MSFEQMLAGGRRSNLRGNRIHRLRWYNNSGRRLVGAGEWHNRSLERLWHRPRCCRLPMRHPLATYR
ncbi:MAG: hypothetical protein R2856_31985 [Caldilineaceae bacterium]